MRLTGIPLLPCHRRMEFLRIWDPKDCVYEILGRREENVKHFRLGDGSFVAVQYDAPVHYLDADGAWQGIDNRLAEDGSEYATSDARIYPCIRGGVLTAIFRKTVINPLPCSVRI